MAKPIRLRRHGRGKLRRTRSSGRRRSLRSRTLSPSPSPPRREKRSRRRSQMRLLPPQIPPPPTVYEFELDQQRMNSPITTAHLINELDVADFYKREQYNVYSYQQAHDLIELAVQLPDCILKNRALRDINRWIRGETTSYTALKRAIQSHIPANSTRATCSSLDDALQRTDALLLTQGALGAEKSGRSWAQSIWGVAKTGASWIAFLLSICYRLVLWGFCTLQRLAGTYLLNISNYLFGSAQSLRSNFIYHVATLICSKQKEWDAVRDKSGWDKFNHLTRLDRTPDEWRKDAEHMFNIKSNYHAYKEAEAEEERIRKGIPPKEKSYWGYITSAMGKGIETVGYLASQTGGWYDQLSPGAQGVVKGVGKAAGTFAGTVVGGPVAAAGATLLGSLF